MLTIFQKFSMHIDYRTIEEITETLIDYRGKTPPKTDAGVRLITAKVIKDGTILDGKHEYIADDYYDAWMRRGLPKQWDILLTTEAPLGEVAQIRTTDKVALAQRVILLRGNPDTVVQQYYFQALKSPFVQAGLKKRATGTTVLGIKQSELRQVEIPLPPLPIQRKIAGVLSAYDDLIENNTRRIKILEEMAQRIYREWLVNFHFPGHEKVKMVDSELGMIPEGWEVKRLGDVLKTLESGSRPKGGIDPTVTEVPSVGAENILGLGKYDYSKEKFVTREFYEGMRKGHIRSRDVLLYKDGAKLGRKSMFMDGFPHDECCINEHAFILRTNDLCSQAYLYFWLDLPKVTRDIINLNSNAAQPGINQKSVKSLTILLADVMPKRRFDEMAFPVLTELFNLAKKNQILRQTRDLLLPKLISGGLDVSEMDIETGGPAQ